VITGRGKRYDRGVGAVALALHPRNGTLLMAGYTQNSGAGILGSQADFSLVKIRKNGTKAWKYDYTDLQPHTANQASAVAVSPTGDVFAGGRTCFIGPPSCFTVVRVDGRGHEVWRSAVVADGGDASFVALDPQDGNVIAAGVLPGMLTVVKLDAASGAVLWTSSLNGSFGAASAATLTNRGTVAVARGGTIREFDTTNGILASSATVPFSVNAMAFDAREGAIVVGGRQQPDPFQSSMTVAKIDAAGTVFRSPLWSRRR
jgi:outer membrane protein assembly factor BamB